MLLPLLALAMAARGAADADTVRDAFTLGYELDITREKVPTTETLHRIVDIVSGLGYGQLQLYFKDNFAYPGHERVWRNRAHLTPDEVKGLDRYCAAKGLELVPYQSSFGHLEPWFAHTNYLRYAEAPNGVHMTEPFRRDAGPTGLCATSPDSIRFIDSLYDVLLPCFRSRFVNAGCDEVWDLYDKNCRSAAVIAEKGLGQVYLDFLLQIRSSIARRGKTMMFWSDIIRTYPQLLEKLPRDMVAMDWNYEDDGSFVRTTADLKKTSCRYFVCPGTSSWCSFWGRHANMKGNVKGAWTEGRRNGAEGLLLTDWGDRGYPQPWIVSLPALVYTAALAKEGRELSDGEIAARMDRICGCRCGESVIRAADAYRKVKHNGANGTSLFRFCREPARYRTKDWFSVPEFQAAVDELRAAAKLRDLAGAPDWVRDDLALSDLLVDLLARRVAGDDGDPDPAFTDAYVRLWNRQNRPLGAQESLRQFAVTKAVRSE